jgi:hypothetical protein
MGKGLLFINVNKMDEFRIEVAGLVCSIKTPNKPFFRGLKEYYFKFLSNNSPDFELIVDFSMVKNKILLDPSQMKEIETTFDDNRLEMKSLYIDHATYDAKGHKGTGKFYSVIGFRNFMRLCFALEYLKKDTLLIHSSAILKDKTVYLFSGASEQGKSTIAKLTELPLLNEEMNALQLRNGKLFVYATPFGGELDIEDDRELMADIFRANEKDLQFTQRIDDTNFHNRSGELKKMFFISKHPKTYLEKMGGASIFSNLMANEVLTMFLNQNKGLKLYSKIFSLASKVIPLMNINKLYFEKNNKFMRYL